MDYRGNKILNLLLYQKESRISDLAEIADTSERMIRKTIKELNEDLQANNLPLIVNSGDNYVCLGDNSNETVEGIRSFILKNNFYTYRLTPGERKMVLSMLLLNAEGYSTAEELSEHLMISRNTVISDLRDLRDWFHENGMELLSFVQKGYIVSGDEISVRKGILHLIGQEIKEKGRATGEIDEVFHYLLLEILNFEERAETIMQIVRKEEKEKDIHFSDFSFIETVYEILILTERLARNRRISIEIGDAILNSSKYPLSDGILSGISEAFGVEVPDIEKKYFVRCLRKKSYLQSSTKNVDDIIIPFMIGESIYRVAEFIHLHFYLDFDLYDVLVDHMRSAVYRIRNNEFLTNPFTQEMENTYPDIFQIVSESVRPLEKYLEGEFRKDEIAYLVMYFAAMKEKDRQEQDKDKKVAVILVGDMGRGAMQYMSTRLEALKDILKVEDVRSAHESGRISRGEADMVVSALRHHSVSAEVPVFSVDSPLLNSSDLVRIREMAERILTAKRTGSLSVFPEPAEEQLVLKKLDKSFISPGRIGIDVEADSWEQAVRKSGELLYRSGDIREEYIEAMIDNIRANGSYIVICRGLAIPHGEYKRGIIREAVGLVRLKEPVCFGNTENDPVRYIACMSLFRADSINSIIYNLVRIFTNRAFLEKMDNADSADRIYQLVREML